MTIQVLDIKHPTARKPHRCSDCGRTIEPGEKYERQANVGDDGFYEWLDCAQCGDLARRVWAAESGACYYFEDGLDLGDWLCEDPNHPLLPLFRARWRDADGALVPLDVIAAAFSAPGRTTQ